MSEYVFLYREKDTDDRDCCKYIEQEYHTDCIGDVILCGACFSGRFSKNTTYDEVETVLSEQDFNLIMGKNISAEDYNRIVGILTSDKGQEFFDNIMESEKEYLKYEYNLDDDDIEKIFDEYYLDYRDRGIVGYVYEDCEEAGREYIDGCMRIDSWLENYIDYDKFGQDLCDGENYLLLDDGRVVSLNY